MKPSSLTCNCVWSESFPNTAFILLCIWATSGQAYAYLSLSPTPCPWVFWKIFYSAHGQRGLSFSVHKWLFIVMQLWSGDADVFDFSDPCSISYSSWVWVKTYSTPPVPNTNKGFSDSFFTSCAHSLWSPVSQAWAIPHDKAYSENVSLFPFKFSYCHFANRHKVPFQ